MKPKNPGAVIDLDTARKNGHKLANREAIELDPKGALASQIVMQASSATQQALQTNGGLVAAFLEGKGEDFAEGWRVHVTGMEFDEEKQSLRITGLRLVPIN